MQTLTVSDAKTRFLSLVRRSHDFGEAYAITNDGKPYSVLISHDEYEGCLETIRILRDKALAKSLSKAVQEADAGRTVSFKEATGRDQRK